MTGPSVVSQEMPGGQPKSNTTRNILIGLGIVALLCCVCAVAGFLIWQYVVLPETTAVNVTVVCAIYYSGANATEKCREWLSDIRQNHAADWNACLQSNSVPGSVYECLVRKGYRP